MARENRTYSGQSWLSLAQFSATPKLGLVKILLLHSSWHFLVPPSTNISSHFKKKGCSLWLPRALDNCERLLYLARGHSLLRPWTNFLTLPGSNLTFKSHFITKIIIRYFFDLLNRFSSLLSFAGYNYKISRDLGGWGGFGSSFKDDFWQPAKKSSRRCFANRWTDSIRPRRVTSHQLSICKVFVLFKQCVLSLFCRKLHS